MAREGFPVDFSEVKVPSETEPNSPFPLRYTIKNTGAIDPILDPDGCVSSQFGGGTNTLVNIRVDGRLVAEQDWCVTVDGGTRDGGAEPQAPSGSGSFDVELIAVGGSSGNEFDRRTFEVELDENASDPGFDPGDDDDDDDDETGDDPVSRMLDWLRKSSVIPSVPNWGLVVIVIVVLLVAVNR